MRRALNSTLLRQLGHGYYRKPLRRDGGTGDGDDAGGGGAGGAEGGNDGGNAGGGDGDKTFTQADIDRIVADRLKRHKPVGYDDLKAKAKELDTLKAANATEQEKAVAEAEKRAKEAARSEASPRIVKAEFKAAAAGRVDKDALDGFLDYADLSKFVGDDGEPDEKAIEAVIAKLAGAGGGGGKGRPKADPSQGGKGGSAVSSADAGRAEAARRFGDKK